jgi:subtilisin family serine protease
MTPLFAMKHTLTKSNPPWNGARQLRVFAFAAMGFTSVSVVGVRAGEISENVKAQIADILQVKSTFSPAEQKMDSRLVFAERKALGKNIGTAAAALLRESKGTDRMRVEIRSVGQATKVFRKALVQHGAAVHSFDKNGGRVYASVNLAHLLEVAAQPNVMSIRVPAHPMVNVGGLTSQGYVVEGAKAVINQLGVDGTGVKVGVLSDSASQAQVNLLIASGDLGPNTKVLVPYDDGSGGDLSTDEGAAMMEIVQDMAPGATVEFATADNTPTEFAANIEALQADGCSIIVDDVGYSGEGPFQDDVIARGINTVTAAGVLYCSAAANSGNVASGTSGTWQGNFVNGGTYTPPTGSGTTKTYNIAQIGSVNYDQIAALGEPYIDMEWSDPLGGSTNDYDFFVTDSTGATLKGFSVTVQNGTEDPVEELDETDIGGNYANALAGDRLVITQTTGAAARFLRIDTNRGELATFTNGSTAGHSAAAATFGVAATFWNSSQKGAKLINPAFTYPPETFSSDGPRQIFYDPVGTPYTAGNFLAGGGTVLQKPDATAVDGVSCETPGFSPFFGTSAAAPHAAGVAALIKSAEPSLTNTEIRNFMTSTAFDPDGTGVFDVTTGFGVLDALAAVMAAQASQ